MTHYNLKKALLLMIMCVISVAPLMAKGHGNPPSAEQREQWMSEMRRAKGEFLIRELGLTEQQAQKFLPLYEAMDKDLMSANEGVRALENNVKARGKDATDVELEKATEAMYELKGREAEIEMSYMRQFKTILTPQQMFKLKSAERKFTRELMKKHRERK